MKAIQEGYKAYPKIHRLGKDETIGILAEPVIVQEKIDGANVSMFNHEGKMRLGSRTRMLKEDESFNGYVEAANSNAELKSFVENYPMLILYGEWLVRHTIAYPETAYKKIYLYDIYDTDAQEFLSQNFVNEQAGLLGLEYPTVFLERGIYTEEEIKKFVGESKIGPQGEGVVIKNPDFRNAFGDHCYAKLVTEKFKENNGLIFGGNNKHSESYEEMYIVNKYCTMARLEKVMNKTQADVEKKLDFEHTPRIAGTCYHDLITEEAWEIAGRNRKIDYKVLRSLCTRKFIQMYHDILNGTPSIADGPK